MFRDICKTKSPLLSELVDDRHIHGGASLMKSRKVKTTQIRTNYEKWGEAAAGKDGTIFVLLFHDRFLRDNVGFRSEIKVV